MSDLIKEEFIRMEKERTWRDRLRFWWHIQILKCEVFIGNYISWYQQYIDLFWLHYYGFYPTAIVKSYYLETTFLFDTKNEAERAFQKCERENGRAIGWYYQVDDFKELAEKDDRYNFEDLNIWWIYDFQRRC